MDELHPDRRRFHCCRCEKVTYICSHCDRGQVTARGVAEMRRGGTAYEMQGRDTRGPGEVGRTTLDVSRDTATGSRPGKK